MNYKNQTEETYEVERDEFADVFHEPTRGPDTIRMPPSDAGILKRSAASSSNCSICSSVSCSSSMSKPEANDEPFSAIAGADWSFTALGGTS